ncbi:hypothetical protein Tco_0622593 [Tanacetum coccineum]
MSSASSTVTYTSVYTKSEPERVFWGLDRSFDGGSPRVIVYGYDGLPMQPIAPLSPDYIHGPEEPQTPLYIPLEDEHVFSAKEQPLPPIISPTVESPGYVVESDPEEDPEEGEDGDDDDSDLHRDDVDDEDEDKEDEDKEDEEEEEEANSAVVVPTVELVSLPEGTIQVTTTTLPLTLLPLELGLLFGFRLPYPFHQRQVRDFLAMPTPPPSPLISLSPPSVGERLARSTAQSTHSSPPHVPLLLLPSSGCPTQIQTLRIASTQALIDAGTAALPSPPLPPSLYIPPPVDRRDDIPESEWPPYKRSCLFALGPKYKVEESSTVRPTRGRRVDYGFVSTLDAEERQRGIREVGYGIRDTWVNTRVTEFAEIHEHDTQDLYALVEDAQDSRTHISQLVTMDSQRVDLLMKDRIAHQETVLIVEEEA